jgi:hypothetical protein
MQSQIDVFIAHIAVREWRAIMKVIYLCMQNNQMDGDVEERQKININQVLC